MNQEGTADQMHLQLPMHGHFELLKLLDVLDHYQTMIIDGLPITYFHFEKFLKDFNMSCATLLTIQLLQVSQHLSSSLHIFILLLKIIGHGC